MYYSISPVGFHFCRLHIPNSLKVFLCIRRSGAFKLALCWTHSTTSMSVWQWRGSNWAQHSRCLLSTLSRGKAPPSMTCCCWSISWCRPGGCWQNSVLLHQSQLGVHRSLHAFLWQDALSLLSPQPVFVPEVICLPCSRHSFSYCWT